MSLDNQSLYGNFLGQLVPALCNQGFSYKDAGHLKNLVNEKGGLQGRRVEVFVTSQNAMKVQAAKNSIQTWLTALFKTALLDIHVQGFGVFSNIDEQPHGEVHTRTGALNRLKNMKNELLSTRQLDHRQKDGVLRVLVSLENGIMKERVHVLNNPEIFKNPDETVWVDRCIETGEIWFEGQQWEFSAISEGVTAPKNEVELSLKSGWAKTAGSFISGQYGWNAQDWHGGIAGKGRQRIMEELSLVALGLPYTLPLPQNGEEFKPNVYHDYVSEEMQFFVPKEIANVKNNEDLAMWREYYADIPQPNKPGPDGVHPTYSCSLVLTEDVLVGYFDEVFDPIAKEKKDVLHIIMLWSSEEGKDSGWILPGKRDRAYDKNKGDISVEDANYSLIEKEIGVDRSQIAYHFILGYFDDRKREQRMKTSGFISFVLLNEKPPLKQEKMVGLPLNGLVQLAKREIHIPPPLNREAGCGYMGRNHDSLILSVIETTKFYHTMEKVKIAQASWREKTKVNPQSARPGISELNPALECPVCMDLLVGAKVICSSGHTICELCLRILQQAPNSTCPECREMIVRAIPNLALENVAQSLSPQKYAERYKDLHKQEPRSWKQDPAFNGMEIQIK